MLIQPRKYPIHPIRRTPQSESHLTHVPFRGGAGLVPVHWSSTRFAMSLVHSLVPGALKILSIAAVIRRSSSFSCGLVFSSCASAWNSRLRTDTRPRTPQISEILTPSLNLTRSKMVLLTENRRSIASDVSFVVLIPCARRV